MADCFKKKIKTQLDIIFENIKEGIKIDVKEKNYWQLTVAPSILLKYKTRDEYEENIEEFEAKVLQIRIQCLSLREQQELLIVENQPSSNTTQFKKLPLDLRAKITNARDKLSVHAKYVHKLVFTRLPRYCYGELTINYETNLSPIINLLSAEETTRKETAKKKLDITDREIASLANQIVGAGHIHEAAKLSGQEQKDL